MNLVNYLCMLILLLPGIVLAAPQDSPEQRREAALRYAETSPMADMFRDAVFEISKQLPEDQRRGFQEFMLKHVRIEILEEAAIDSMVKHFTAEELNAIADFYGSPLGRSSMKKFGVYMADIMPSMEKEMMRAAKAYEASRQQENTANK